MLSIVTITKNDPAGLKRNLESTKKLRAHKLVDQTIIDGSSSNNQKENKKIISFTGENITYFYQPPRGITPAFNLGLKKTKGKWIWFLNGGDEYNSKIDPELLISILESSSAQMIVFNYMNDSRVIKKPPIHSLWPPIPNWLPHPAIFTQKELLTATGGFSEKYKIASDYEKILKICLMDIETDFISIVISKFTSGGASANRKKTGREGIKIILENAGPIIGKCISSYSRTLKGLTGYVRGK